MILGQISLLDCLIFVIFLIPQLLVQRPIYELLEVACITLPFLLITLPTALLKERLFTPPSHRSPFVQHATFFQDLVIRCTRLAFARFPAAIGAVFLSKPVAHPFARFRMLRHGYVTCPITYYDIYRPNCKGIWMIADPSQPPDVVVYYIHGGGFSMGSAYFYLEYLLAWLSLLRVQESGGAGKWRNPAVFALEYTLVPEAIFPMQVQETLAGYEFCLEQVEGHDPARVCVAGDSAGATLAMSLLLVLAGKEAYRAKKPGFATLVSPWCNLVSEMNKDTASDFLNAESLHMYARQYVGETSAKGVRHKRSVSITDALASPGDCRSREMWVKAAPTRGYHFIYGAEEVFAPSARQLAARLERAGSTVVVTEQEAAIHAWPVVALFLGETKERRLSGLRKIVEAMVTAMD